MKTYIDQTGIEVQPFYPTNEKIVKSGSFLESYKFGKDILLGRKTRKKKTPEEEALNPKPPPDHAVALKSSARRAKRMIKRLTYTNSFKWLNFENKPYLPITITLTFRENIQDLKMANYEFTKFIRRLNYEANKITGQPLKQSNLKYLGVIEQQERGAIHYHIIFFNLPFIPRIYDRLRDIWKNGMINVGGKKKGLEKIKTQKKLKKIIDYFIKYVSKSIFEDLFPGQKKYITSKGLLKPKMQYFKEVIDLIKKKLSSKNPEWGFDGESKYNNGENKNETGQINYLRWMNYHQYDLSKDPELEKEIDEIMATYS